MGMQKGPAWGQRKGSGETARKLLQNTGVMTIPAANRVAGHYLNSSYTLWFWSNYIHSVKRHHIMRSMDFTEADRRVSKMSDCTRNRPENSADFIMM